MEPVRLKEPRHLAGLNATGLAQVEKRQRRPKTMATLERVRGRSVHSPEKQQTCLMCEAPVRYFTFSYGW